MLRPQTVTRFLRWAILFLSLPAWAGLDAAKEFLDGEIGKTSVLDRAQQEAAFLHDFNINVDHHDYKQK